MSEKKWTAAQRSAIDARGCDLLLSAAAGSGKTATLTQRIIELIEKDGASVDRILAVTFTEAAAAELRSRIAAALNAAAAKSPDDLHIIRQISALENAHISTMHSFFNTETQSFAERFGLPPQYRTLDTSEAVILRGEAASECIDKLLSSADGTAAERFRRLADCISGAKRQESLEEALIAITDDMKTAGIDTDGLRKYCARLRDCCGEPFKTGCFDGVIRRMKIASAYFVERFTELARDIPEAGCDNKDAAANGACLEASRRLGSAAESGYAAAYGLLSSVNFPSVSSKKVSGAAADVHAELKDTKADLKDELDNLKKLISAPPEEIKDISLASAELLETLADTVDCFDSLYSSAKRERGAIDFNDMEQFALKLFVSPDGTPTPEAKAVGEKYDYVFIDEYQDTNELQDRIFSAIASAGTRFMVGDVKQSIYGFRGARPEVFTDYRRRWSNGEGGGRAVFMSENFRSSAAIIDFSNLVSRYIFATGATPFEKEDELICSKISPGGAEYRPVTLCLVEKDFETADDGAKKAKKSADKTNPEAEYTADAIAKLLKSGTLEDGSAVHPGDIAILLRGGTHAEDYAASLAARGIPADNEISENFFAYGEVLLMICLLRAADNPVRDIYLAGAMKSPVFGFTLEELVSIHAGEKTPLWYSVRTYATQGEDAALRLKCTELCDRISKWQNAASEMYADEILRLVTDDSDIRNYGGDADRSPADIARSLKIMEDHAASVARRGGGLHDLVRHLEAITGEKDPGSAPKSADSVKIITIHHSKGLEFPVCFLCETDSAFSAKSSSAKLVMKNGCAAIDPYDKTGTRQPVSPLKAALCASVRLGETEEEARVLYVALTRARERLIVTCKTDDAEKTLSAAARRAAHPVSEYEIFTAKSLAQWMIDAAVRSPDKCVNIETVKAADIGKVTPVFAGERGEKGADMSAYFADSGNFVYENDYLSRIPSKLTVSVLAPDTLNATGGASVEPTRIFAKKMPAEAPKPRFLSSERHTASEAGTATHIFMQFCDWKNLFENGAAAELERLSEKKFISTENASLVRLDEIELFRKSGLMRRLLGAREVLREKRFNTVLPAERFTTDPQLRKKLRDGNVTVTVQGVVDCMFTDADGRSVLVDYKTDRLSKSELDDPSLAAAKLTARHSRQLGLYSEICKGMLGHPFDEVYIYSLPLGDVIPVKL